MVAEVDVVDDSEIVVGAAQFRDDPLKLILERMDKIEAELKAVRRPSSPGQLSSGNRQRQVSRSKPLVCWNCGGEGHVSRNCSSPDQIRQQHVVNAVSHRQVQPGSDTPSRTTAILALYVRSIGASDLHLHGNVGDVYVRCLIDTGAAATLMDHKTWEKIAQSSGTGLKVVTDRQMTLVGVQGTPLKIYGTAEVDLVLDGVSERFHAHVTVADSLTSDVILGQEFLGRNNCIINMGRKVVPKCEATLVRAGSELNTCEYCVSHEVCSQYPSPKLPGGRS